MSALPPKADISLALGDVRFVPLADGVGRTVNLGAVLRDEL